MEAAPALNARSPGISHAVPSPTAPSARAPAEQRLRAMIARHPIAVKLHGLPCERASTVSEILMPRIRHSPLNNNSNISHLDLTECWKGLSQTQVTELTMWSHFFQMCMHDEVRANLNQALADDLLQSEELVNEAFILPRILDSLRQQPRRVIDINYVDIIDSMMGMFHDQFPHGSASVASNWSHFSGGLSRFLHNFLRAQDCLCDSANTPCLKIDFEYQCAESVLLATGVVAWQAPDVRFLPLKDTLHAGQEYRITPFILSDALDSVHSLGSDHYADQTTYTISQSLLDFSWCSVKRCFIATAPDFGDVQSHTIETVLTASIVTPFPDGVRFERKSRWTIKLNISPAFTLESSGAAAPTETQHIVDGIQKLKAMSREAARMPRRVWTPVLTPKPVKYIAEVTSTKKRKVSNPEAFELKRRCYDLCDENWDSLFVDTHAVDERRVVGRANNTDTDKEPLKTKRDSGCWPSESLPKDSTTSPTNTAISANRSVEQQEYMSNYYEFLDRKLFKDMGLPISPVSKDELQAYARIFMGDSDLSSPVTDESAMDLDASDD